MGIFFLYEVGIHQGKHSFGSAFVFGYSEQNGRKEDAHGLFYLSRGYKPGMSIRNYIGDNIFISCQQVLSPWRSVYL